MKKDGQSEGCDTKDKEVEAIGVLEGNLTQLSTYEDLLQRYMKRNSE